MPGAIYIHIPFCNRICPYCDFNKYVLKGQPVKEYLLALKKEIQCTLEKYPYDSIQSIFVGGGTPTTLTAEEMKYFLEFIQEYFPPQTVDMEFTIEANPETVTKELLQVMKEGGVNRLSFGVQTFHPELLKKLGRMHSPEDVFRSIDLSKEIGIDNLSIDLMFGLPNQSVDLLHQSIDKALQLDVPHISAYSLKIEEGTFYQTLYQKDKLSLPSEEEEVHMYDLLMNKLPESGYKQYEISNFARAGFESKHNLTYWRNQEYYGFGAGAHGYVNGTRHVNASSIAEYIQMVNEQDFPYTETHLVTKQDQMEDMMIMGLRIAEGVSSDEFYRRYKVGLEEVYGKELMDLIHLGLLETDGQHYFLTKKGKFLGNEVFAAFLKQVY